MNNQVSQVDRASIETWLTKQVAFYVECQPEDIDPAADVAKYGLDSIRALILSADIEDQYGLVVDVSVAWDHRSIDAMVNFIMAETSGR